MERTLFVAQRLSAVLLGPLVVIHLGLILVAIRQGLSGAEILARTNGSLGWALFYGLFVIAAAVHAPIGMRNVLREWSSLGTAAINMIALLFGLLLLVRGLRAVWAVI